MCLETYQECIKRARKAFYYFLLLIVILSGVL